MVVLVLGYALVYYTIVVHNFNLQEKTISTVDEDQYNSKMSQAQNCY